MNRLVEEHGNYKHGLTEHPLYKVWAGMKHRCRTNRVSGEYYYNRGIKICIEWQEFMPFYNWATISGYQKGLTLDRINNNGNYEPLNCRWTTYSVQNSNKRKYKSMPRNS